MDRNGNESAELGARVGVAIPTLNEEKNLAHVFARLPHGPHEVIVVDGHSTYGTIEVERPLRPGVRIVMQQGRAKRNAPAAGFAPCPGDVVVSMDTDGLTDPAEIPRVVGALLDGADFVKGSRFTQVGASSDITWIRPLETARSTRS
jgi:glycosyltransferase involved in cell wall biosynthesis